MTDLQTINLQNTDEIYIENDDDNSTVRRVLVDIECLINFLSNEFEQNKHSISTNLVNYSLQTSKTLPSLYCPSSSTTITNVTINDENHRHIEQLRHRINELEHERKVLLTSYELLLKLLKQM